LLLSYHILPPTPQRCSSTPPKKLHFKIGWKTFWEPQLNIRADYLMFWEPWLYICIYVRTTWEPAGIKLHFFQLANTLSTVMDKVTFVHVVVELFFQDYAG
jgi:hypothetical protein